MKKLNDGIHHCSTCDIYPCTYRPEVVSFLCAKCPMGCCHHQLISLMPCEEGHYEKGWTGGLKCEDGDCYYLTPKGCSIFKTRPIVCRIADCGFVRRGEIPEYVTKALNSYKSKK